MKRFTYSLLLLMYSVPTLAQTPEIIQTASLSKGMLSSGPADTTCCAPQPRVGQILAGAGPVDPIFTSPAHPRAFRVTGAHEFDWLQPRFSNNVSAVVSAPTRNFAKPFDHSYEPTSRVWVGIENCRCNGIRARYWYLDTRAKEVRFATAGLTPLFLTIEGAGGSLSRTAFANAGDAMTSSHHLQMRTIDLEATHRSRVFRTNALWAIGLRYAKTHQRTHVVATDGTGALTELVGQNLDFEGFGPTFGVDLTRCLFAKDAFLSRLSCFGSTRWSMLMGRQEQEFAYVAGGGAIVENDEHRQDDFLPIGELACGLQWVAQPFGYGLWTIRTGYRAEAWWGTGGPVDADSNLGLHGMLLSIAGTW